MALPSIVKINLKICSQSVFPFNHYHDVDFFDALTEYWFCHNVSFVASKEKICNPFEFNYKDKINLPIDYGDPDLQFFNDYDVLHSIMNSEYFTKDIFNTISNSLSVSNMYFSMLHVNIHSIPKHISHDLRIIWLMSIINLLSLLWPRLALMISLLTCMNYRVVPMNLNIISIVEVLVSLYSFQKELSKKYEFIFF